MYKLKEIIRDKIENIQILKNIYEKLGKIKVKIRANIPDDKYIKKIYKEKTGSSINLEFPQTYTDKVNYLKMVQVGEKFQSATDKYEVRKILKSKGLSKYLVPLIGVYTKFEDIPFDEINKKNKTVFIKTTHGSGTNYRYENKLTNFQHNRLKNRFEQALKEDYSMASREKNYQGITPRLIVEESIAPQTDELLEYKLICINGKMEFGFAYENLVLDNGDKKNAAPKYAIDRNYNESLFYIGSEPNPTKKLLEKPVYWDEMLDVAEKLSSDFDHVRVDLMAYDNKIYFSELTFYFGGGNFVVTPTEFDSKLGNLLEIEKLDL